MIDASIPLGVKPFQVESPVNQLAKVLQIQNAQQDNQLGRMKMDEYQRGIEDQNALRAGLGVHGADPYKVMMGLGKVKEATEYQKAQTDSARQDVETEHKAIGIYRDASQSIMDPQSAADFVATMHSDPRLKNSAVARVPLDQLLSQIPQDPAQLGAWKQQFALGATKFMELNKPTTTLVNAGGTSQVLQTPGLGGVPQAVSTIQHTQSPDNAASVAQQERNSRRVDDRARDANAQGKVPSGYRAKADGTLEFIPGGPADPSAAKKAAPTEFQGKSAMFGSRAGEADRIITELTGKFSPSGVNMKNAVGGVWGVGGALEAGANQMLSPDSQKAEQAQRDFTNAILRLESGAAIGKDEFDNAKRQYFPQPGDSREVIAQKAANRKRAVEGLMGNARTSAGEPPRTGQSGGATGDFGGQPSDLLRQADAIIRGGK